MTTILNELGPGWRIALAGVCLVGLAASVAVLNSKTGDAPPPGREVSGDRPPIDLVAPVQTETATFALG